MKSFMLKKKLLALLLCILTASTFLPLQAFASPYPPALRPEKRSKVDISIAVCDAYMASRLPAGYTYKYVGAYFYPASQPTVGEILVVLYSSKSTISDGDIIYGAKTSLGQPSGVIVESGKALVYDLPTSMDECQLTIGGGGGWDFPVVIDRSTARYPRLEQVGNKYYGNQYFYEVGQAPPSFSAVYSDSTQTITITR
jgi:hypothetical protein